MPCCTSATWSAVSPSTGTCSASRPSWACRGRPSSRRPARPTTTTWACSRSAPAPAPRRPGGAPSVCTTWPGRSTPWPSWSGWPAPWPRPAPWSAPPTTARPRACTPRTPTAWSSRWPGWSPPTCWTTRPWPPASASAPSTWPGRRNATAPTPPAASASRSPRQGARRCWWARPSSAAGRPYRRPATVGGPSVWGNCAREARCGGLSVGTGEAHDAAAQGLDAHVVAGVGGRDPLSVADVDRHVRDGAVVEDEIARLELAGRDAPADVVLGGAGVGERDAGLPPGHHGQARAVEAAGARAAVAVGLADLGPGVGHDRRGRAAAAATTAARGRGSDRGGRPAGDRGAVGGPHPGQQGPRLVGGPLDLGLLGGQAVDLGGLGLLGGDQVALALAEGLAGHPELVHQVAVVGGQQLEHLDAGDGGGRVVGAEHGGHGAAGALHVGGRGPGAQDRPELAHVGLGSAGLGLQALEGPPDPLQGLVALVVLLDQLVGLTVQLVELILEAGGGGRGRLCRGGTGGQHRQGHQDGREQHAADSATRPATVGGPSCAQRGQAPVLLSSRLQLPDTGWRAGVGGGRALSSDGGSEEPFAVNRVRPVIIP